MLLVGLFLPVVIEYINKDVNKDYERFIMAVITCALAAILMHPEYLSHLEFSNLSQLLSSAGQSFVLIYAEASLVFKVYWQNSFARDKFQEVIGVKQ